MISRNTVVVAALSALMVAVAPAASGSVPTGSASLIPAGTAAPYFDQLELAQGSSSSYVIYTSRNTGFANQAAPFSPAFDATVEVRDGSGTATMLDVPGAFEPSRLEVSGSIVIFIPDQASTAYDFPTSWYDLANDTHGTGDVPTDALAASKDGWLTPGTDGSADVTLTNTSTTGTVTSLGTPLAGVKSPFELDITPGPDLVRARRVDDVDDRTVVKNSAGSELGTGGKPKTLTGTITVTR